jgi:hypothetical protein
VTRRRCSSCKRANSSSDFAFQASSFTRKGRREIVVSSWLGTLHCVHRRRHRHTRRRGGHRTARPRTGGLGHAGRQRDQDLHRPPGERHGAHRGVRGPLRRHRRCGRRLCRRHPRERRRYRDPRPMHGRLRLRVPCGQDPSIRLRLPGQRHPAAGGDAAHGGRAGRALARRGSPQDTGRLHARNRRHGGHGDGQAGGGQCPAHEGHQGDNWQPDHGVLFTASPTLFGRIYNAYYCDGTQGRDFSKCERLSDADPYKLGVLTP